MSKIDDMLLDAAKEMFQNLDKAVDNNLPQKLAEIVKFHSKGAAAAGIASGWIPGASGVALATVAGGFVWTMYGRINSEIGLPFTENVIKSLATGVATNLAAYAVGSIVISTALSFIPGLGSIGATVIVGATSYALTLASGYVYLKLLANLFASGQDPTKMDTESLKKAAKDTAQKSNIKDFINEAKKSYKK